MRSCAAGRSCRSPVKLALARSLLPGLLKKNTVAELSSATTVCRHSPASRARRSLVPPSPRSGATSPLRGTRAARSATRYSIADTQNLSTSPIVHGFVLHIYRPEAARRIPFFSNCQLLLISHSFPPTIIIMVHSSSHIIIFYFAYPSITNYE